MKMVLDIHSCGHCIFIFPDRFTLVSPFGFAYAENQLKRFTSERIRAVTFVERKVLINGKPAENIGRDRAINYVRNYIPEKYMRRWWETGSHI